MFKFTGILIAVMAQVTQKIMMNRQKLGLKTIAPKQIPFHLNTKFVFFHNRILFFESVREVKCSTQLPKNFTIIVVSVVIYDYYLLKSVPGK